MRSKKCFVSSVADNRRARKSAESWANVRVCMRQSLVESNAPVRAASRR
jgi:hypothetical protein